MSVTIGITCGAVSGGVAAATSLGTAALAVGGDVAGATVAVIGDELSNQFVIRDTVARPPCDPQQQC
jgi:hypothetical protein